MLTITAGCASARNGDEIPTATASFRFPTPSTTQPERTIRVYTYRSASHAANDPIALVMHGASRNANDYRDRWIKTADKYNLLIVAPRIDKRNFSWEEFRPGGIVRDRTELPVPADGPPRSEWTFTLMERLFGHVRDVTASNTERYDVFGHSAGGQFAHRFALFQPESRARAIVSAILGWYTFPDEKTPFPYGFGGITSATSLGPPDRVGMFGKCLLVLVGAEDTNRDRNLLSTPEADAQGPNRLSRGRAFFEVGQDLAKDLGLRFRWDLLEVPGVGHSSADMIPYAG